MQTKDLLKIVVEAQKYREESWNAKTETYTLTLEEALERADVNSWEDARANVNSWEDAMTPAEKELALFLIRNAWNEVQDWAKQ